MPGKDLVCSVYRKLLKNAARFDQDGFRRNLLFDVMQDGGNFAAAAVANGESLVGSVKREFKKVDPLPLEEGFKGIAYLTAANELAAKLPRATPPDPLDPLEWTPVNPQALPDAFVMVTHPLAYWNDALLRQSIILVFKESRSEYGGIVLNNYNSSLAEGLGGDLPQVLGSCELRIGGYQQGDRQLAFIPLHEVDLPGSLAVGSMYLGADTEVLAECVPAGTADPRRIFFFIGSLSWTLPSLAYAIESGRAVGMTPPDFLSLISPISHPDRYQRRYLEWQSAAARLPPPHNSWATFPAPSQTGDLIPAYLDKLSHIAV